MTRPTVSRADLRRAICVELMMPFALRYKNGFLYPSGTGTQTTIIDTKLTQPNDYWNGSWVFIQQPTNEAISLIKDFASSTLILETPLGFNAEMTFPYEIHSVFNAIEIHQAINRAIADSHPAFYEEKEEEAFVISEARMDYPLNLLTSPVEIVLGVEIEQPVKKIYGEIESFTHPPTTYTITDSRLDLSEVDTTWLLSFYGNLGDKIGVWTTITNVNKNTKTITAVGIDGFNPTNGMKFMLWNPHHQEYTWFPTRLLSFDKKEWPSRLRLHQRYDSALGHRIKIRYTTVPSSLVSDVSTTVVPQEYIIAKAVSLLAASRINDNRVDRQRYAGIAQQKAEEAEMFRRANFFRRSDIPIWMEGTTPEVSAVRWDGNPLNWGG